MGSTYIQKGTTPIIYQLCPPTTRPPFSPHFPAFPHSSIPIQALFPIPRPFLLAKHFTVPTAKIRKLQPLGPKAYNPHLFLIFVFLCDII